MTNKRLIGNWEPGREIALQMLVAQLGSDLDLVKAENKKLRKVAEAAKELAQEWERYPGQLTGFENNLVDALGALEMKDNT